MLQNEQTPEARRTSLRSLTCQRCHVETPSPRLNTACQVFALVYLGGWLWKQGCPSEWHAPNNGGTSTWTLEDHADELFPFGPRDGSDAGEPSLIVLRPRTERRSIRRRHLHVRYMPLSGPSSTSPASALVPDRESLHEGTFSRRPVALELSGARALAWVQCHFGTFSVLRGGTVKSSISSHRRASLSIRPAASRDV